MQIKAVTFPNTTGVYYLNIEVEDVRGAGMCYDYYIFEVPFR